MQSLHAPGAMGASLRMTLKSVHGARPQGGQDVRTAIRENEVRFARDQRTTPATIRK
jgi:hypothetical protein